MGSAHDNSLLTVDAILDRCFVLFDSHGPGTDEVFGEELLEFLQVECGRTPLRWIVDLMSKSGFEGLDYGCRDAFGANQVIVDDSHLLDIFVFRFKTDATVEMYDVHVRGLLICGY
jgi:hypothetical protein